MGDFDIGSLFGGLGDISGILDGGGGGGGGGGLGDLLGGGGLGDLLGGGGLGSLLGGGMGMIDPLSGAADMVSGFLNKLGVPKEITDAGKIVGGIYTGDPGLIIDGGVGELGDLSKDAQKAQASAQAAPALTELPPEEATPCSGYCDSPPPSGTDVSVDVNATAGSGGGSSTSSVNVDVDVGAPTGSIPSTASSGDDSGSTTSAMNLDTPDVLNWVPSDPQLAQQWTQIRDQHDLNSSGFSEWGKPGKDDYLGAMKMALQTDPEFRS